MSNELNEIEDEISNLEQRLSKLKARREEIIGVKVGEFRTMSKALLENLRARSWWRTEHELSYNTFHVQQVSSTQVLISSKDDGGTTVATELVIGCEIGEAW